MSDKSEDKEESRKGHDMTGSWVIAEEFSGATDASQACPRIAKHYGVEPDDIRVYPKGDKFVVKVRRSAIDGIS